MAPGPTPRDREPVRTTAKEGGYDGCMAAAEPRPPCATDAEQLARSLPEDAVLDEAVMLLKGFADPTRLKILLLLREGDVCVHQIVEALAMTQSAVSHQLRTLRGARLVAFTKRGRHVYYRLADGHVRQTLDGVLSHSREVH